MRIQLNGEPRDVDDNLPLPELISSLKLKPEQIAVELNHQVIRRGEWPSVVLRPDDKVEIVHFVGGGCYTNCWFAISRQRLDLRGFAAAPPRIAEALSFRR